MNVKQLKKLIKGLPDDMDVLIPTSEIFDGYWYTPCAGESGINEMEFDEDSDERVPTFILVPHGFFDEEEEGGVIPELN